MQIPQLTFTRFVAAVIVLIFHGARSSYPFTVYPGLYLVQYGYVAVVYFFILSGFILTITYRSALERTGTLNLRRFWVARLARIYPLYVFALLLTIVVQTTLYDTPALLAQVLASLGLVQSWFPSLSAMLNGPGWSLSVEAFFYALFPLLLVPLTTLSSRALVLLLLGSWLAGVGLFYGLVNLAKPASFSVEAYHNLLYYSPWIHLATFVNGCISGLLFWRYVRQYAPSPARNRYAWIMLLLGAIGLVASITQSQLMVYAQGGILTPVFILFIVGLSLQTNTALTRLFSWRLLVYLGEISYGLYILQMPLIRLFKKISLGNGLQRDLLTFGLLFLATIICYHLIERPAQTFIRNRWSSKRIRSN